ncbi:MAG: THUMP domain-containing protein [Planctomycetota bacterium]|nr:THUMP domain-containing protein [Planctomycetota bacterium]
MAQGPREEHFAVCAPGLEPWLHQEIKALKFANVERQVAGVRFDATVEEAWRANLELRTAIRVLKRVTRFTAKNEIELAAGIEAVDWSRWIHPDGSLRVDARSKESALDHTLYIEQRTKDAVCDSLRARFSVRPTVSLDDPDLGIDVHLYKDRCTVSVDTSGDSLHKRGYRRYQGRAPLAETFGAAAAMASRWDRRSPFVDPFCGSGTILIEAARLAGDMAPGLFRGRFGFERWPGHDAQGWSALKESVRARGALPKKLVLKGSDVNPEAIAGARENAEAAGVASNVVFEIAKAETIAWKKGWNAWVVTNPPWGERVGDERGADTTLKSLGDRLRVMAQGYRFGFLLGKKGLDRSLGLQIEAREAWLNGGIECEFVTGGV